ncbi:MAG: hypothetical protein ACLRFR_03860, partial [Clostridia bacterium]
KMKKKKHLKIFAVSSLALIMSAGVLCGVLAPTGALVKEETINQNTSISPLGLNPKNDPVIYTTESGLDIKFGATPVESGALAGYTYFTMGNYEGTDINWVIIGRHSSTTSGATTGDYEFLRGVSLAEYYKEAPFGDEYFENWLMNEKENISPAGVGIDSDWDKQIVLIDKTDFSSIDLILSSKEATSEIIDAELDPGEILVISEKIICSAVMGGNNYDVSGTKDKMNALFESELNFTDAQKKLIMPQYLNNFYHTYAGGKDYDATSYTSNAYLFPLAWRGESFSVGTYLSNTLCVAYNLGTTTAGTWWTRSGNEKTYYAKYYIGTAGKVATAGNGWNNESAGIRPAMVLRIG